MKGRLHFHWRMCPGQVQDLPHGLLEVRYLSKTDPERPDRRVGHPLRLGLLVQPLEVELDGGEGVSDLVGDAGGEFSHYGHLPGLLHPVEHLPDLPHHESESS